MPSPQVSCHDGILFALKHTSWCRFSFSFVENGVWYKLFIGLMKQLESPTRP